MTDNPFKFDPGDDFRSLTPSFYIETTQSSPVGSSPDWKQEVEQAAYRAELRGRAWEAALVMAAEWESFDESVIREAFEFARLFMMVGDEFRPK